MASLAQKERENFYRIATLVVDYIRESFTNLVDANLSKTHLSFEQFINQHQHEIYHLCYNTKQCCQCSLGFRLPQIRVLNPEQLKVLFDKNGPTHSKHRNTRRGAFCCRLARPGITTKILDVTLARCILVNFCMEIFWYSCLTQPNISFENYLNKNKHIIYHLLVWQSTCCQCPLSRYVLPVQNQVIDNNEWNTLFSNKIPPCVKHGVSSLTGPPNVCSVSATSYITTVAIGTVLSKIIIEHTCPLRKSVDNLIEIRNKVYGHATGAVIPDSDYEYYRKKAEAELMIIASICNTERDTKQRLEDLQRRTLDETILIQYQNTLLSQITLESDIRKIHQKMEDFMAKIKSMMQEETTMRNEYDIKRQRIIEMTTTAVKVHVDEKVFVYSNSIRAALQCLEEHGLVTLTGPPGAGKTRSGLELLYRYSEQFTAYSMIKLTSINDWENMINVNDNYIVLCDDIFGKTNCNYNADSNSSTIDDMFTCVKNGKVKLIITMGNNMKRDCDKLMKSHRLFKCSTVIDINSDGLKMNFEERRLCLLNHLKVQSIEETTDAVEENYTGTALDRKALAPLFIHSKTVDEIAKAETSILLGFPEACYLFANNKQFTRQGVNFFTHANTYLCDEINYLRKKDNKEANLDYIVLLYVLLNGDKSKTDLIKKNDIIKIFSTVFSVSEILISPLEIKKSVSRLTGVFLNNNKNVVSFQHRTLFEAVLLSYCDVDYSNVIPLMDFELIVEMTRPCDYTTVDGEVAIVIPEKYYQLLSTQLMFHLQTSYYKKPFSFVYRLCSSKLFQLASQQIASCLCDEFHKTMLNNRFAKRYHNERTTSEDTDFLSILNGSVLFDLHVALLLFCDDTQSCTQFLKDSFHDYFVNAIDENLICIKEAIGKSLLFSCIKGNRGKAVLFWNIVKTYSMKIECLSIFGLPLFRQHNAKSGLELFLDIVDDDTLLDTDRLLSMAISLGEVETAKWLLDNFDDSVLDVGQALTTSAYVGNEELIRMLLKFSYNDDELKQAVRNASRKQSITILELLLFKCDTNLLCLKYAMNIICCNGYLEIAKRFPEMDDKGKIGLNSSMHTSVYYRHMHIAKYLWDTFDHDNFKMNKIMNDACLSGDIKLVKELIEICGVDAFNLKEALNWACKGRDSDLIRWFLRKVDAKYLDLVLIMNWVCFIGNEEIVYFLLSKYNIESFDIKTAFNWACFGGHMQIVKMLLLDQAKTKLDLKFAMDEACRGGAIYVVEFLFQLFDKNNFDAKS